MVQTYSAREGQFSGQGDSDAVDGAPARGNERRPVPASEHETL